MRFPHTFYRQVGGGSAYPALGSDTVPTSGVATGDYIFKARFKDIDGYPGQRLAVTMSGPATTDDKTVALYFLEENSGKWYQIPTTTKLSQNQVKFFDIPVLINPAQKLGTPDQMNALSVGSLEVAIVVSADGTAPNGVYVFAAALTSN